MLRTPLPVFSALCLFATLACANDSGTDAGDSSPGTAADTTAPTVIAAAPALADSVIPWAIEIREGVAPIPARVASDLEGARQRAVELYVTRQERIEQVAGPGTGAPADLAAAVHEAEARFHDLMQLLGATPPPDSIAAASAVRALDERLAEVIDLAGSSGPADSR